jgi:phosphoglycolate phosphatase
MKLGILFDLDGTLLNTLDDLYDAVNYVLRQLGYPERSLMEIRRFVGNGARRLVEQALPGEPTEAQVDKALQVFQDYYNSTCSDGTTCPYPGILEMLEELKKSYPVAVVSNKPDPAVKALCKKYFPGVLALGVTEKIARKPAPDMVFAVMKQMDVGSCIYVGDSEVDVLTAKNANIPCISVLWGFRDKPEIEAAGGSVFCEKAADLPDKIESIIKNLQT